MAAWLKLHITSLENLITIVRGIKGKLIIFTRHILPQQTGLLGGIARPPTKTCQMHQMHRCHFEEAYMLMIFLWYVYLWAGPYAAQIHHAKVVSSFKKPGHALGLPVLLYRTTYSRIRGKLLTSTPTEQNQKKAAANIIQRPAHWTGQLPQNQICTPFFLKQFPHLAATDRPWKGDDWINCMRSSAKTPWSNWTWTSCDFGSLSKQRVREESSNTPTVPHVFGLWRH